MLSRRVIERPKPPGQRRQRFSNRRHQLLGMAFALDERLSSRTRICSTQTTATWPWLQAAPVRLTRIRLGNPTSSGEWKACGPIETSTTSPLTASLSSIAMRKRIERSSRSATKAAGRAMPFCRRRLVRQTKAVSYQRKRISATPSSSPLEEPHDLWSSAS